jgi:membrane-associated phospholipid phosphatase
MRSPIAIAVAVSLAATPATAAPAPPEPIHRDVRTDAAITASAVLFWAGTELAKPSLAPSRCRWCEPPELDERTRSALVWDAPLRARRASDVVAFGMFPAGVAAHQLLAARRGGDGQEGLVDVLVVAESAALAAVVTQVVKYSAGRQRPRVRHGTAPADPADDNLSFFSGHTSLAFALATAAGSVSSQRGYDSAPWVWGTGLSLASGVAWLRIAGDQHWLTDVLAGAAVGSAFGIAVPRLLHGRERGNAAAQGTVVALPLGVAFAF